MVQIKSRISNEVIFEYEGTIKDAVEKAVRQGISLENADLKYVNLACADLSGADLNYADLRGANLNNANLKIVGLRFADLRGVKLIGANLRYADLRGADLRSAPLIGANLRYADISGANFRYANLSGVDLRGAIGIPDDLMPLACPAKGSFVAWKKVRNKLVKLVIPSDAKRTSATTNKCRCSKAKVLAITDLVEIESFEEVINGNYAPYITYKVGEMVYPDSFDEYRWNECSNGIHFFMDKNDALNW